MLGFDETWENRLAELHRSGLLRHRPGITAATGRSLSLAGRELLNFGSNDYLGLARHPAVVDAAIAAVRDQGAGSGASRLLGGSSGLWDRLDDSLAAFKGTARALTFASGYATAIGTIPALVGRHDIILFDRRVHACLIDAAELSGATRRVCRHLDLDHLESQLRWARCRCAPAAAPRPPRILILTESVFSMDGDLAPLAALVALKERYGAWLLVDEAHATGLFGPQRGGLVQALGLSDRVEVQMGTLGKALGAAGGFICGSNALIDHLLNQARSFMFSTAPVPAAAAAAQAAIDLVRGDTGRELCSRLWERVAQLHAALPAPSSARTWGTGQPASPGAPARSGATSSDPALEWGRSAIAPVPIGDESTAVAVSSALLNRGIYAPAIRFPTVPRRAARLRLTVTAVHTPADLQALSQAIRDVLPPAEMAPRTSAPNVTP